MVCSKCGRRYSANEELHKEADPSKVVVGIQILLEDMNEGKLLSDGRLFLCDECLLELFKRIGLVRTL